MTRPLLMTITDRAGRVVWKAEYADCFVGRMAARSDRDVTLRNHFGEGLQVTVVNRDRAAPFNLDGALLE